MTTKLLYLFTRTPLHVGAGSSVGAIDQPIQRERHTGFPIIPATSLKGSFADQWPVTLKDKDSGLVRITSQKAGEKHQIDQIDPSGAAWLFGSDDAHVSFSGALRFSEARLLAFPIRSARGSFAWITCPLILQRARRDGVILGDIPKEPTDDEAIFKPTGPLAISGKIVLEEYCLNGNGEPYPGNIADEIADLMPAEEVFQSVSERFVIVSNGTMSHFVMTACEIAQHVRISDETGTAEGTGLFNQENVPADTLFYSVVSATKSRVPHAEFSAKTADDALNAFTAKVTTGKPFQFGGDASTGLGFTSVTLTKEISA
jgi:CRISPR-associated protein Cmr4